MNVAFFGTLDTSLFLTYSLFQFLSGSIGDNFDKKRVLSGSYLMQALCFLALFFAGVYQMTSHFYFLVCFVLIGLS